MKICATSIALTLVFSAQVQAQSDDILALPPESATSDIDRTDPAYVDLHNRVMAARGTNSIAIHMLARSVRGRATDTEAIRNVLVDSMAGVAAAEHFPAGRSTWTYSGEGGGSISASPLVEALSGFDSKVGAGFDVEFVRRSGELVQESGRVQAQTGISYVVPGATLSTRVCGSIAGDGSGQAGRLLEAGVNLGGEVCYQYDPQSVTPLGAYDARFGPGLAIIEKIGGDDLDLVVDELYRLNTNGCGYATLTPKDCGLFSDNLAAVRDANLARDLPTDLRTPEAILADPVEGPTAALVIDALDAQGQRVAGLERQVGRALSALERAGLLLATQEPDGQSRSLTAEEIATAKTEGVLEVLNNPKVQQRLIEVQARGFEVALRRMVPLGEPQPALTPDEVAFKTDVKKINEEYDLNRAYIQAADATVRLASALIGDPDLARDFGKVAAAAAAANEIVRAASIVSSAISTGQLLTTAAMGAYTGGATAALSLIGIFAGSGGGGDMQAVLDYLDQRFDRIDANLEILLDRTASMDRKLDALLQGQAMIISMIRANARAIDATRFELAILDASVEGLRDEVRVLSRLMDLRFLEADIDRQVRFDAELAWAREDRLAPAAVVLGFWLNPDARIVAQLNAGGVAQTFLNDQQKQRQSVIQIFDLMAGPTFVRTPDVVRADVEGTIRPPAQTMSLLPEAAEAVDAISAYLHKKGAPDRYRSFPLDRVDEFPGIVEEAAEVHSNAFPRIDRGRFIGLQNPDALFYVLKPYLTFALVLNLDARQSFGFSDLPAQASRIDGLVASVEAAQSAAFVLMATLPEAIETLSLELADVRGGGTMFERAPKDMLEYVFRPGDIRFPESFRRELPEETLLQARAFVDELHADPEAIAWLQAHGNPYLTRGATAGAGGVEHRAMLSRIAADPAAWIITAANATTEQLRDEDEERLFDVSLDILADLRALHRSYQDGELFEFKEEELVFADRFAAKSILQLTRADIAAFVDMIRSDRQLIKMMRDEGLLDFVLDRPEAAEVEADVVPGKADLKRVYATVRYVNPNMPLAANLALKQGLTCAGVDLEGTDWPATLRLMSHYLFPLDRGGRVDSPTIPPLYVNEAGVAMAAACFRLAASEGRTVIHPVPYVEPGKTFHAIQYLVVANASKDQTGEFLRSSSMVPDGTPLWHSARNECVVRAEWTKHAGADGANTAAPIAMTSRFVVEYYESPFLYASQAQADVMNDIYITEDDEQIDGVNNRLCEAWGQVLPYGEPWERKQVGQRHPAAATGADWVEIPVRELVVVPDFRADVVEVLEARRGRLQGDRLARIAASVQDPPDAAQKFFNRIRDRVDPSQGDQDSLLESWRAGRWAAFSAHPLMKAFLSSHPEEAADLLEYRALLVSRLRQPALLRTMAEWGFGDCLYTTRALAPWGELLAVPVAKTDMTLIEALQILSQPAGPATEVGLYGVAAETVIEANARFRRAMGLDPTVVDDAPTEVSLTPWRERGFPPHPVSKVAYDGVYEDYPGIDHAAAISMIEAEDCKPGHASIMALADLGQLMRDAALVQN